VHDASEFLDRMEFDRVHPYQLVLFHEARRETSLYVYTMGHVVISISMVYTVVEKIIVDEV
jgi:hypothetical protein